MLETLLWPDEVREAAFPFLDDDIEVRPQELKMATSLIDSMTVDFDLLILHRQPPWITIADANPGGDVT